MAGDRQSTHKKDTPSTTSPGIKAPANPMQDTELALQLMQAEGAGAQGMRIQAARHLSGLMGNRMLQRIGEDNDSEGDEVTTAVPGEEALPADLHEFLERGMLPDDAGRDMTGGTGIGGFNARFDPGNRELVVTMNLGFSFLHGMEINAAGMAQAVTAGLDSTNPFEAGAIAHLNNAVTSINAIPDPGAREAEVNANWRWTDAETTPWMNQYKQNVEDAWGGQHFFVSERWPQLMAGVRLNVVVHAGNLDTDHCATKIVKMPPDNTAGAGVMPGQGTGATPEQDATNAHDQSLFMTSAHLNPREDNLLDQQVYFPNNVDNVNLAEGGAPGSGIAAPGFLRRVVSTYQAADPNNAQPIRLVGHASTVGAADYNQALSERRSANVEAFLHNEMTSRGINAEITRTTDTGEGETGMDNTAESRRVDIIVGDGQAQVIGNHEFGHLLGLDDEYVVQPLNPGDPAPLIGGTGNRVGDTVDHTDVDNSIQPDGSGADIDIDGAVAENNDNIMSLGNTVRPQHYSTFHNALQVVTGENWRYGGAGDVPSIIPGTEVPGGVIT